MSEVTTFWTVRGKQCGHHWQTKFPNVLLRTWAKNFPSINSNSLSLSRGCSDKFTFNERLTFLDLGSTSKISSVPLLAHKDQPPEVTPPPFSRPRALFYQRKSRFFCEVLFQNNALTPSQLKNIFSDFRDALSKKLTI